MQPLKPTIIGLPTANGAVPSHMDPAFYVSESKLEETSRTSRCLQRGRCSARLSRADVQLMSLFLVSWKDMNPLEGLQGRAPHVGPIQSRVHPSYGPAGPTIHDIDYGSHASQDRKADAKRNRRPSLHHLCRRVARLLHGHLEVQSAYNQAISVVTSHL